MAAVRTSRFVVMMTDEEIDKLQQYRFSNQIDTKAGAARELISRGLESMQNNKNGPAEAATSPGLNHATHLTGESNDGGA